jgi:hypothetical protein
VDENITFTHVAYQQVRRGRGPGSVTSAKLANRFDNMANACCIVNRNIGSGSAKRLLVEASLQG